MHRIDYDADSRIMTLTLEGFWDAETMQAFTAELFALGHAISAKQGGFNVLCDSRAFPVQSGTVTDNLAQIMRTGAEIVGGYGAVVFGTILAKMQADRLYTHPHIKLFLDFDEACAWLKQQPLPQG